MVEQVDTLSLVLLVAALVFSAFFSSSETAFMSLQRVRLRHLERTGVRGAARVRRLVNQADRTLVTILVGNNLVNTAAAALATLIVTSLLGAQLGVVVATVGVTILLLVFGEITPKTLAIRHSEQLALLYAVPLDILSRLFTPVTVVLGWVGTLAASLAGGDSTRSVLSEEEIRTVILMGEEAGVLHREETAILRNALQLESTPVRQVMVPRTDVVGVPAIQTCEEVALLVAERGYTRMPVFEGNLDRIVGVVHAKDVLVKYHQGLAHTAVSQMMRPALFVPESKNVSSLLTEMRGQNSQIAVVIDEYGGTAGIVTLEDLLEELVGEITSEYGAERRLIHSLNQKEAVVDASIAIEDLSEAFGIDLPADQVDTLGGFVSQQLGRLPKVNDRLIYGNVTFVVLSMHGRRAGRVKITKGG